MNAVLKDENLLEVIVALLLFFPVSGADSSSWCGSPGRQFMITLAPSNSVTVKGIVVLDPTGLSLLLIMLPIPR